MCSIAAQLRLLAEMLPTGFGWIVGKREVGRRLWILDKHASFRRPAPHIPPGNLKTLGEEKLGDEKEQARAAQAW